MLDVTATNGVATVVMDHGPVNALDPDLLAALRDTVQQLDQDPDVAAVVLTGNDRVFCAGMNIRQLIDGTRDDTARFLTALSEAIMAFVDATTPVVAAVNGHAIAGGVVLAAACDQVVLTDEVRTRVGLSELTVGIPFPTAAIEVMRRRLGPALADAVWRAALYAPEAALTNGFVDQLAPAARVLERATELAVTLAAIPPATRALTSEQLSRQVRDDVAARAPDWDEAVIDAWSSDDGRAAMRAFEERTLRR